MSIKDNKLLSKNKSKSSKETEDIILSKKDSSILEESINLISKLSKEVGFVETAKNKLQQDLSILLKKIEEQEKKSFNKITDKKLDSLKKDIISQVEVLSLALAQQDKKSSHLQSSFLKIKKEVLEDLKKYGLNFTAVESNVKKLHKDFSSLRSLVGRFENDLFAKKTQETKKVEEIIKKEVTQINQLITQLRTEKEEDKKVLVEKLDQFVEVYYQIEKKIKKFQEDFTKEEKNKLNKIKQDFKSQIEKFEKFLSENLDLSVEKFKEKYEKEFDSFLLKVKNEFDVLKSKYNDFQVEREEEHKYFENQLNFLTKQISFFEEKLEKLEIDSINDISEKVLNLTLKSKEDLEEKYSKFTIEINDSILDLQKYNIDEKNKNKLEFENFKNELAELSKTFTSQLDIEFRQLQDLSKKFEEEKDLLAQSIREKIKFELVDLSKKEEEFTDKLNSDFELFKTNAKEEISQGIINLNLTFNKIKESISSNQTNLKEELEEKFNSIKEQFSTDYDNFLLEAKNMLSKKENEFTISLKNLNDENQKILNDFEQFKVQISKLTQDYSNSLNEKLLALEKDKNQFESKEQRVLDHIDMVVGVEVEKLQSFSQKLDLEFSKVLEENRIRQENSENSFRSLFNEKISNFNKEFNKSILLLREDLLKKNLSDLEIKLDSKLSILSSLDKEVSAKQEVIRDYIEEFDLKLRSFQENFSAKEENFKKNILEGFEKLKNREDNLEKNAIKKLEEINLKLQEEKNIFINQLTEKIELRLTNQEKSLNRRFLGLEEDFSSFKSIVVSEVEDSLKEITNFVNEKTVYVDKILDKLNFNLVESTKKLKEFQKLETQIENSFSQVRDDVNDLRVKFEITHNSHHFNSTNPVNNMVYTISEYEKQVIGLVESLREKGFSDLEIKDALVSKGHPRMYVSLILSSLD